MRHARWAAVAALIVLAAGLVAIRHRESRVLVRGRVVDETGAPILSASVFVVAEFESPDWRPWRRWNLRAPDYQLGTSTDRDGTFALDLDGFGAGMLEVTAPNHMTQREDFSSRGRDVEINIRLARAATIRGRAINANGSAVAAATIVTSPAPTEASSQPASADDGSFSLGYVPFGPLVLDGCGPSGEFGRMTLVVTSAATSGIQLPLTRTDPSCRARRP